MVELIRVPGWDQYEWLRAGFSTRFTGESAAYGAAELNLGWTQEDDPVVVKRNRAAFVHEVSGGAAMAMVTVGQVHSAVVRDLQAEGGPLTTPDGKAVLQGDGLVDGTPGRLLAVLTADCVPVLVADTRTHAVGAFHAGWRGTLGRIVEQGIACMRERYGTRPEDLVAAVGPCIRECCFEVGTDVRDAFGEVFPDTAAFFRTLPGDAAKFKLDLVQANRQQLDQAGLRPGAIQAVGECTACARRADGRRRYYSYRGEHGQCGRMLSAIGALA